MSLTTHLVIQKEVKLYHQGKLLHCKWNGQSEAWDVGNVSWHGGLTMHPLGSDWMCSRNSFYWEAELGPNTSLPFLGSMQVSKTTQRCTCVSLSVVSNSVTPWTVACQASLFITSSWNLLKLMSIESMMSSNHLTLSYLFLCLHSIFPGIRVFSNESALCIRWPKYGSFNFSISPSIDYSELISFRIDWFVFLAVQGTLRSLLHHNSKASVLSLLYGPAVTSVHDTYVCTLPNSNFVPDSFEKEKQKLMASHHNLFKWELVFCFFFFS